MLWLVHKGFFRVWRGIFKAWLAPGPEGSTAVKQQSGINGLLPTRGAGPFHLFRLLLDLRCAF
jgi:hypothetical protein